MFKLSGCVVAVSTVLLAGGRALAGPDWVEHGDAGSNLGGAQQTIGTGAIHTISGTLGGQTLSGDFEDMYLIRVLDPGTFSMKVIGANFDAQLWVFNVTLPGQAFGLLANDNTLSGINPELTAMSTDGTGAQLKVPGVYAIAISGAGRVPISLNGPIFFFGSPTEISGPDGPGGINPHLDWTGQGATGSYTIQTDGVGFYDTPAPASIVVLAGGAIFVAPRRRK